MKMIEKGDRVIMSGQTLHDFLAHGHIDVKKDKGEVYEVDGPNVSVEWVLVRDRMTYYEMSQHKVYEMDWDERLNAWIVK